MTALTLPIARLRSAGCRVSTIIGHDPNIGDFLYSVTLPKGIPGHYQRTIGQAFLQSRPAERRVIIRSARYRVGQPIPDRQERNAALVEAARLLESLADHVDTYDRASSASRQHYIDTGRYLTHVDVEEWSCMHDTRCEAHWNDGICACPERAEPPLKLHRPEPKSALRKVLTRLAIHR